MPYDTDTDTRSEEMIAAHTALAEAGLDEQNTATLDVLQDSHLEGAHIDSPMEQADKIAYKARLSFAGVLFTVVEIDIFDAHGNKLSVFKGFSGGLAFGGGISWGTIWLNQPIQHYKGTDARFQANMSAFATNCNLWEMNGAVAGNFVGGGFGAGAGIVGGQGSFS